MFSQKSKKVFLEFIKVHIVSKFQVNRPKITPCGSADAQTDTQTDRKLPTPIRRKNKKEAKKAKETKRQKKSVGVQLKFCYQALRARIHIIRFPKYKIWI